MSLSKGLFSDIVRWLGEKLTSVEHAQCQTSEKCFERPLDFAIGIVPFEGSVIADVIFDVMVTIFMLLNVVHLDMRGFLFHFGRLG